MAQVPLADTVSEANLDVRLEAVAGPRPKRASGNRNPFRFGSESLDAPADPDLDPDRDPAPVPITVSNGSSRPGTRLSPLELIGVVDAPNSVGLIAVLTDGEVVFQGRVGDTVEGRYRITRIATDTVEVELLPAGGRRVLHMEGS